jgi:hypothetical protein
MPFSQSAVDQYGYRLGTTARFIGPLQWWPHISVAYSSAMIGIGKIT